MVDLNRRYDVLVFRGSKAALCAALTTSSAGARMLVLEHAPYVSGVFGTSVERVEDEDLLRGNGRLVDGIHFPGLLQAAFLRSPHAHAAIGRADVTQALALPGVQAVFMLDDLAPHLKTTQDDEGFLRASAWVLDALGAGSQLFKVRL